MAGISAQAEFEMPSDILQLPNGHRVPVLFARSRTSCIGIRFRVKVDAPALDPREPLNIDCRLLCGKTLVPLGVAPHDGHVQVHLDVRDGRAPTVAELQDAKGYVHIWHPLKPADGKQKPQYRIQLVVSRLAGGSFHAETHPSPCFVWQVKPHEHTRFEVSPGGMSSAPRAATRVRKALVASSSFESGASGSALDSDCTSDLDADRLSDNCTLFAGRKRMWHHELDGGGASSMPDGMHRMRLTDAHIFNSGNTFMPGVAQLMRLLVELDAAAPRAADELRNAGLGQPGSMGASVSATSPHGVIAAVCNLQQAASSVMQRLQAITSGIGAEPLSDLVECAVPATAASAFVAGPMMSTRFSSGWSGNGSAPAQPVPMPFSGGTCSGSQAVLPGSLSTSWSAALPEQHSGWPGLPLAATTESSTTSRVAVYHSVPPMHAAPPDLSTISSFMPFNDRDYSDLLSAADVAADFGDVVKRV